MTHQEAEKMLAQLKSEGLSEEEILGALYKMFQNDEINIEGLEGLVETLGWHFTDEFRNMSPEDQKTKGYEEVEDEADSEVSEEVVDAAKEYPAKEDEEGSKPQGKEEAKEAKDEKEEEEAMHFFGLKGKK